jgi:hypothetical protein
MRFLSCGISVLCESGRTISEQRNNLQKAILDIRANMPGTESGENDCI